MSYVAYNGLKTPNEVLAKMADYIQSRGYTVIQPLADDLNIYDMSYSDGKRYCFLNRTGNYFINLRSANGTMIWGTSDDSEMDATPIDSNTNYTGIGMTVSEGYTSVGRWYNQYKVPKKFRANDVCGAFMPMKSVAASPPPDWQADVNYVMGDVVLYDGVVYTCINNHVSGSSISLSDFKANPIAIPDFTSGTSYNIGDVVRYSKGLYICTKAYTSGTTIDFNYFSVITGSIRTYDAGEIYRVTEDSPGNFKNYVVRVGDILYITNASSWPIDPSDTTGHTRIYTVPSPVTTPPQSPYFSQPYLYHVISPYPTSPYTYTLYCNNITNPSDTIVFTLMKEDDDYRQCVHLIYADVDKYDNWDGGAFFSGSSIKELMPDDVNVFEHNKDSDLWILQICSSGDKTNSFLRIDIDEAPSEARGEILWASSGKDNITGKKMSLPIRMRDGISSNNMWKSSTTYNSGDIVIYNGDFYECISSSVGYLPTNPTYWRLITSSDNPFSPGGNGEIPHYFYLQSITRLDWGRNINTLNCITIDMPIFVSVCVDPDVLENYAAAGSITGVHCISTLNMQTGYLYERSYPKSNDLDQIFPHGKRRGFYGFDGISIKQEI